MSISPQSLARTRDKRSLKVPARFNDTVYNEVHYKETTEVLRASTRSRPGSLVSKRELEEDDHEETEEVLKAMKASNRSSVPSKKQNKSISNDPAVTKTITTMASSATSQARPLAEQIPNSPTTPPPSTTPSPVAPAVAVAPKPATNTKKRSSSSSSRKKPNGTSLIFKQPTTSANIDQVDTPKAPPKPSATLPGSTSNFTIHHRHNQPMSSIPNATPIAVVPGSPSQITTNYTNQGAVRHFNGLTANHQQQSARILINEPLYLPRSVGTIAPITTNLVQFTNQLRRSPFLSKKSQACLAYQEARKLDYITKTNQALARIAQDLSYKDRLNLRQVSKSWKSIVDSDAVWEKVLLTSEDIFSDIKTLKERIFSRYEVKEVTFDRFRHSSPGEIAELLVSSTPKLKRIHFKSTSPSENYNALLLMVSIAQEGFWNQQEKDKFKDLKCEWTIKVGVDPCGVLFVRLRSHSYGYNLDRVLESMHLEKEPTTESDYPTEIQREQNFDYIIDFHDLEDIVKKLQDSYADSEDESDERATIKINASEIMKIDLKFI